jgi:hypothetical protein
MNLLHVKHYLNSVSAVVKEVGACIVQLQGRQCAINRRCGDFVALVRCCSRLQSSMYLRYICVFAWILHVVTVHIISRTSLPLTCIYTLRKSPDMHHVKHKLIKNTRPSHHAKHDDTQVPPKCSRAGKQVISRHSQWLDLLMWRPPAAVPEVGALACLSAPTSTSTRWALVTV